MVKALAGYGVAHGEIAVMLGIDVAALTIGYAHEMVTGPIEAVAKMEQALFAKAQSGDVAAMAVWLRQHGGWF
jgi:hypothetical protein